MKKIMILGAGDFQLPLIKKASERCKTVIVAPEIPKDFFEYVDIFYKFDLRQAEEILETAIKENIDGIITDQTDIAVKTVAYVAEKMNLPGIGYETGKLFTDKFLMRKKLAEMNIPTLPYKVVSSLIEAENFFKNLGRTVILKPKNSQGSRGVVSCNNISELRLGYDTAVKYSFEGTVIIEQKAFGREIFVEGISLDYKFINLCCGETIFFETVQTHAARSRIAPANIDKKFLEKIYSMNEKIIQGFGLKQGISHSEYIADGENLYLLETAARGGGMYISSDIISILTGLDTENFLLDIALGKCQKFPEIKPSEFICGYISFYLPQGEIIELKGVEEILNLPYVHSNQLKKLKVGLINNKKNLDKTTRFCIILSADSKTQFNSRAEFVMKSLRVVIRNNENLTGIIWR